jgi:hypothetical protein
MQDWRNFSNRCGAEFFPQIEQFLPGRGLVFLLEAGVEKLVKVHNQGRLGESAKTGIQFGHTF